MRILSICADLGVPVLGYKGASVHVRAMVDAFVRAGHDTVLVAPVLNKSPWEAPAAVTARLMHVPPGPAIRDAVISFKRLPEMLGLNDSLPGEIRRVLYHDELLEILRHRFAPHPPDFVYERMSLYGTAGAQLAQELGVPLVLEVNSPIATEQATYRGSEMPELAERAERYALGHADVVAIVSEDLRDHVVGLGADPARVHVVANGVDVDRFSPARADGHPREGIAATPVLGFVGGLRPWHGVEALPEVLARLSRRYEGARLVIVGDGPLRSKVEAEADRLGVGHRVELLGQVAHDRIPDIIRSFDIALAPYPRQDRHAFYFSPLKLFEYLACGVPVVASDVGQLSDVLAGQTAGVLCPPGDVEAMADACASLIDDSSRYAAIAAGGRALVTTRFTWDGNARSVVALVADR